MGHVKPTEITKEIIALRETARYKIIQDYFGKFFDTSVVASCYTRDDAEFLVKALKKAFQDRPFDFRFERVDIYNQELDELTSDLFAGNKNDADEEYFSIAKDCEKVLLKQRDENMFFVPGKIGGKVYVICREGEKRFISEAIITDIFCRKYRDCFVVNYYVYYDDGTCICSKQVIYGIDAFITEAEAKVALALIGQ